MSETTTKKRQGRRAADASDGFLLPGQEAPDEREAPVSLERLAEGFPIPTTAPGDWWAILGRGHLPRGIYRGERRMAELPYVLDVIRRRGTADRALYRLCMTEDASTPTVRVYRRDLPMGEWGISLDIALPSDKKLLDMLATAVIIEGKNLGEVIDSVPSWTEDGKLHLPPRDILPAGYGATGGQEEEAREAWQEIAQRAARHPKLALILGAAVSSPFVRPLGRQSCVWHACGEARQGKTTAQFGAAATIGFPGTPGASGVGADGLIKLWSSSIPGMAYALGDLGTLPAFRDELGASGLTPSKLEEMVFLVAQGGQRTVATRYTQEAATSALWGGDLFSTGNDSITGQVANAGVHARVVELATPIVGPADSEAGRIDAEWFQEVFLAYYGWPLHWLRESTTPQDMAEVIRAAEAALPLPVGGISRTLGQHLARGVAGAALLDRLCLSGDMLRTAALEAARAHLDSAEGSGGESPGTLLLDAILSAMADRPGAWPTRQTYERMTEESSAWTPQSGGIPPVGMDRKIEGIQWPDGSVIVSKESMAALAAAADLKEATVALRELRDRDLLVISPSQRKAKKLENEVKLNGRKMRRYQVTFPEIQEDGPEDGQEVQGPGSPEGPTESGWPAGSEGDRVWREAQKDEAAPAVPCPGYAGGQPCTEPLPSNSELWFDGMHATCTAAPTLGGTAGTETEAAPAVPAPRPETGPAPVKSAPALAWAVLKDGGRLILEDGTRRTLPEGWADSVHHIGHLAAILRPEGIKTLYVPSDVAAGYGLPEEVGPLLWNEGHPHPFTQAAMDDGWDVAPEGLAHWMTVYREGEKGNGGTIVFPAWDADVDPWRTASAEHVARTLAHVHAAAGVHYFRSPQTTMGRMVAAVERTHYRTANLTRIEVPEIRYELPGIYAPAIGSGIDLDGMYLHSYDVNKQYASACRGTDLATAPYEHVMAPEVGKYPGPGFWRLRADVTELRPRTGLRPVIDPARIKGRTWEGWVPTPTMTLLRDAGRTFDVLEAWVSPAKRRFLDQPMGMVTEAVANLRALSQAKGDPEDTASVILKTAYASWVNGTLRSTFGGNRREDDPWYRPDVTAMIQAQADARKARLLMKAAEAAPVHIVTDETDCIVVLSADPNWETAVPGLALDPAANGKFKHAGSSPVTEDIVKILRNAKRAKSGRCLDIKEAIKAHQGGK